MSPRFVVVTVNYCCAEAILTGLDETVRQLEAFGDAAYWIVDNLSPDGSVETLRRAVAERGYGTRVRVIAAGQNGGFGAGNNVAIREAMALATPPEYFYILNPDAIPRPGAIAALVDFMETHETAGAAGGLLCDETGRIQSSLFRFPSFLSEIERALAFGPVSRLLKRHIVTLDTPDTPTPVDWVAGTSFIVRLSALRQAGLFDETFFLYWEEIELCHRIRAAGFEIYGVPEAVVLHTGGVSTGMHQPAKRMPPYWFFSRRHFFLSSRRGGNIALLNISVALSLMFRRLHQVLRGRPLTPPHFLYDFVRYSFFEPPKRDELSDGK